jgi:hypothetical protein
MSNNDLRSLALAAAMAGLLAGSGTSFATTVSSTSNGSGVNAAALFGDKNDKDKDQEKHVCKGHNSCKGKGGCKSGDNGCRGKNSCKGKGGCATDGSKRPS